MLLNTTSISRYSLDFLSIFGIGFAALLILTIIVLSLFKFKRLKGILTSPKKRIKIPAMLILGCLLGIGFGFISWLDYWLKVPIFSFINFSLLAVFAYQYSLWIFLGALIPEASLITCLYLFFMPRYENMTFETYYLTFVIFAYVIFVMIGTIIRIYSTKNQALLIFVTSFVGFIMIFFTTWLVTYLSIPDMDFNFFGIICLDILFSWLAFLLYYVTFKLIYNFVLSYQTILKSGHYAEPGIYNQQAGIMAINKLIQSQQYQGGFLISIYFENEQELITKYGLSGFYRIKKQWNHFFTKFFPFQDSLQFINENHHYCYFIGSTKNSQFTNLKDLYQLNETNQCKHKLLMSYKRYFDSVAHNIIYNNEPITLKLKSIVSLYNLHSGKIKDLINFNHQTYLNYQGDQTHSVLVYNPQVAYNSHVNLDQGQRLDRFLHDCEFDIKFHQLQGYRTNHHVIYEAEILNLGLLLFGKHEIYEAAKKEHLDCLLKRYLVIETFKQVQSLQLLDHHPNHLILVDYDWTPLNTPHFDVYRYLSLIKRFHWNPNQIILNFDLNEFDLNSYSSWFIYSSLQLFRQNHIKIAFSNINEQTILYLQDFVPDYAFIKDKISHLSILHHQYYGCLFNYLESNHVEIIY